MKDVASAVNRMAVVRFHPLEPGFNGATLVHAEHDFADTRIGRPLTRRCHTDGGFNNPTRAFLR